MKKILFICSIALVAFSACEPVTKDVKPGGVLKPEDLIVRGENVTPGSNSIVLYNDTPGVTGQWQDAEGANVGVGDVLPLIRAALGDNVFKFVAFCDGGTVTSKDVVVNIQQVDVIPASWYLLAGKEPGGRIWEWEGSDNASYGDGGYGWSFGVGWSALLLADMPDGEGTQYFKFDLEGGANFTKYAADGTVIGKGSFGFDDTKTLANPAASFPAWASSPNWSIGELALQGATIPHPVPRWGGAEGFKFCVIKMTDEELILGLPTPGVAFPVWSDCTFWYFKARVTE